jgi:hypothetical protein
MAFISDMINYMPMAFGLRGFFHDTITLEESKKVITLRIQNRESNFLNLVEKGVFQYSKSPYLKLFKAAGYEFGDVTSLVEKDGLETALQKMLHDGVYLSYEEFKRGKEVVRGSSRFQFDEHAFDNPFLPVRYQVQSSGSRSDGTRTTFDLGHQMAGNYYRLPMLAVNNALDVPLAIWQPVLPAVSGISNVLGFWQVGKPVDRWFSPVDEKQVQSSLKHRLAMRYIINGSRLWGVKLAKPEYVGMDEGFKVAQWMADAKKQSGGCCIRCAPSRAVKICQAVREKGLDISGTHFMVGSEPLTPAKRQIIEATGASVSAGYSISEIGRIGCGCLQSTADDVHLCHDFVALIQHPKLIELAGTSVNAFLFTTLLTSAPKILINLESDDYGVIETRKCDCLFGQLGFNTHVSNIRSFAKLTGSGMTIIGTDLTRVLEEILPLKYGGVSTDYQLLEEEDKQGQTRISLIISPEVGAVDETAVIETLLNELRIAPHPGKLAAGTWSQANTIRIKRMHPFSNMGKVLTLHLMKNEHAAD